MATNFYKINVLNKLKNIVPNKKLSFLVHLKRVSHLTEIAYSPYFSESTKITFIESGRLIIENEPQDFEYFYDLISNIGKMIQSLRNKIQIFQFGVEYILDSDACKGTYYAPLIRKFIKRESYYHLNDDVQNNAINYFIMLAQKNNGILNVAKPSFEGYFNSMISKIMSFITETPKTINETVTLKLNHTLNEIRNLHTKISNDEVNQPNDEIIDEEYEDYEYEDEDAGEIVVERDNHNDNDDDDDDFKNEFIKPHDDEEATTYPGESNDIEEMRVHNEDGDIHFSTHKTETDL